MTDPPPIPAQTDLLRSIAQAAIQRVDVASVAIFVIRPGSTHLELGAASGVEGPPLERLIEAVRDPGHPISRTFAEGTASFDVKPVAPGGPALRSHVPLVAERGGKQVVVGVLAAAHEVSLGPAAREDLTELAAQAAAMIGH